MQPKFICLFLLIALIFVQVNAGIEIAPMQKYELTNYDLKCVPGLTTIRMEEKKQDLINSEEEDDGRRSHMNWKSTDNDYCKICTCSVEGKQEWCSRRPANNVNECLVLARLADGLKGNIPFDHEWELSNRVRRFGDFLWHKDEIPYEPNAKCQRGFSYYSNSISAKDTDIDVPDEVNSLIDYPSTNICFYCVCHTHGRSVRCIHRNPWFCEYYRQARQKDFMKKKYDTLYQFERPSYFRSLSYRLRRTLDVGLMDMLDFGGDSLCCSHSDGHRRSIHSGVRAKLRLLRKKLPKEDLLEKADRTRGDYDDFIVNND